MVGARGDAAVWVFRFIGRERLTTDAGPVDAVKFIREPRKPHDTQAEVWLDPARHYLPRAGAHREPATTARCSN